MSAPPVHRLPSATAAARLRGAVRQRRGAGRALVDDFFQNGVDETRPRAYVSYYEPYASPCYNPLARLS